MPDNVKTATDARIERVMQSIDDQFGDRSAAELDIIRENVKIALTEGREHRRLSKMLLPVTGPMKTDDEPAVPELSAEQIAQIDTIGKQNPWADRASDYDGNCITWVREFYGQFIPGLLTNHIWSADPKLYNTLKRYIKRSGLPSDLNIPSRSENRRRLIHRQAESNPHSARIELIGSEWRSAEARKDYRAKHSANT